MQKYLNLMLFIQFLNKNYFLLNIIYKTFKVMTLGNRLKELRGRMKTDEFSEIFKVSASQISRIENDKSGISPELAISICEYFDCSLDWLLRGIEPKNINIHTKIEEPHTDYVPMSKHLEVLEKYNKLLEERVEKQEEKIRSGQLQN